MDTLEGLADDLFNDLPISNYYILHYFLCDLSGKNSME